MAQKTSRSYMNEYLKIARSLEGDEAGHVAAEDYLASAGIVGGASGNDWALTPYLLDSERIEALEQASRILGSIMEKTMAKYHRDRSFRALFGFSREVEQLTVVPSGCHAAVPLSRVDLFFGKNPNDFTITGIATGGLEGMAASVEATRAVELTGAYREFTKKHTVETLNPARNVALRLLHTYGKWANAQEGRNHPTNPSLAVVDVPGSPRGVETAYIIDHLHELGCYAYATEVGELRMQTVGGVEQLVDNHGPVTCVWLRLTADQAIANWDNGISTLMRATRHGLVCTIGGYRSWPCCTKEYLEVLRSKECRMLLNREENEFIDQHIDETHVVDTDSDISQFYDQDKWVLRMADGHLLGSVRAGSDLTRSAWRNLLVKAIKRRDAAQAFVATDQVPILPAQTAADGSVAPVDVSVMLELFVFEGRLSGIRAICGSGRTLSSWKNRMEMGVLAVRS